jgi:NADH dehydrogenase/NADH:ubiquinone oxidoreductase subunit G
VGLPAVGAETLAETLVAARLLVLCGERLDQLLPESLRTRLAARVARGELFLILHATRLGVFEHAQVALPARTRAEKHGSWVNVEGLRQSFPPALPAPFGIRNDQDTFQQLGEHLSGATRRPRQGVGS